MRNLLRNLLGLFKRTKNKGAYKPVEYIEKDTKCDKCANFSNCYFEGKLLEITNLDDTRQHYTAALGNDCAKRG